MRLFVNNILSVQTHNVRNIFFDNWSTTLFLFGSRKLVPKEDCEKMAKQLKVEKGLTSV